MVQGGPRGHRLRFAAGPAGRAGARTCCERAGTARCGAFVRSSAVASAAGGQAALLCEYAPQPSSPLLPVSSTASRAWPPARRVGCRAALLLDFFAPGPPPGFSFSSASPSSQRRGPPRSRGCIPPTKRPALRSLFLFPDALAASLSAGRAKHVSHGTAAASAARHSKARLCTYQLVSMQPYCGQSASDSFAAASEFFLWRACELPYWPRPSRV